MVPENEPPPRDAFLAACAGGDTAVMRTLLDAHPNLVDARDEAGATALHRALPHPAAVRLLLDRRADPNARDMGDNALPLHFAAAGAPVETVRALLDAGSDVHGAGDAHALDVIGWAACFAAPRPDIIALLLERGARHHVFSAIAVADHDALRELVHDNRAALQRHLAPSEQEQTALHYCVAPPDGLVGGLFRTGEHYRTLELLVALGADLDALDAKGRTALEVAMLRGDRQAMRILHAAGARVPESPARGSAGVAESGVVVEDSQAMPAYHDSVVGLVPMLAMPNIDAAVAWYRELGFELTGSNGPPGRLDWAEVRLGEARIMFASSEDAWRTGTTGINLWLHTTRIDDLYAALRSRQFGRSLAFLTGQDTAEPEIRFMADLHTTHYGLREFAIADPGGNTLTFAQPAD